MSALVPRLTPEQYMDLLAARREEYYARREHVPDFPALLEWFVRDGDEDLVDMAAVHAASQTAEDPRPRRPRRYRPASYWRDRLAEIDARLDALNGGSRHGTGDLAAYGGIGIRQTPRQQAAYARRIDATAAEHVRLSRERQDVAGKLRRAEAREDRQPPSPTKEQKMGRTTDDEGGIVRCECGRAES